MFYPSCGRSRHARWEDRLLQALRTEVYEAHLELVRRGLVMYTFGNASGVSRAEGLLAIKPSGVPYDKLRPAAMVITDLEGRVVEGSLRPSSDLPTHAALYRAFPAIGGIVHTHSRHATAWAQAGCEIPCFGTTHADYFCGAVPVTAPLKAEEIDSDYEANTGAAIIRLLDGRDPLGCPAALVHGHAPFCWGESATDAVHTAVIVEELAAMAWQTLTINPAAVPLPAALRDKHYYRKHGPKAYYGQG
jgi:L-ribulose-5-phosphate 4-epimerase